MTRPVLKAFVLLAALAPLLTPPADARPGGGRSMGSRGSRTYSAPPMTRTSPFAARPMERSYAPRTQTPGMNAPFSRPANRPLGFAQRRPFLTGFAGGLLGAGLFGMLSGHGFFGGIGGGLSFLGFLFQVAIFGFLIVMLLRWLGNRRNNAAPNAFGGGSFPGSNPAGGAPFQGGFPNGAGAPQVTISNSDYQDFQRLLLDIQAAWSAQNMRALSTMATPEMVSYFSEQLSDYASRGARNIVSDVRFLQGDLAEAWHEGNMTYATVAMQYSLIDVTTDSFGNVIDGSKTERQTVTELWTFVRADGRGNWILSAIQQTG
ncbi:Tim44 domain-containing protein [Swaminathania salitolerans]|uniref:Membrane protein n=1 Tax=Swaminathania salitolerans TaxID=182838 RepID=A0A511BU45_9PROT|nr:TIM44-like domain-containing protein [Swaminathania salitolerans]GBQ15794.1 mitochondrial import inner membrane translocase subunit Tim44 [Swaminathania salitolerans LMG 21291]GEL01488.1 membrane protein [Swaminathania salitolerans]